VIVVEQTPSSYLVLYDKRVYTIQVGQKQRRACGKTDYDSRCHRQEAGQKAELLWSDGNNEMIVNVKDNLSVEWRIQKADWW